MPIILFHLFEEDTLLFLLVGKLLLKAVYQVVDGLKTGLKLLNGQV